MGWTSNVINQLVIQGTNAGLFIYDGTPSLGTLIGSWASNAGVDPYGNPYPTGINVLAGSLQSVSLSNSVLIGGTIISTLVSASQIQGSTMLGGNISETVIKFDTGGGNLFLYSSSTTTNTYTTSQNISAPAASVASMSVQAWGGDAGAGGGNTTQGGEGGGGAEFAWEPAYPNYNPGGTYAVNIGRGGNGGTTNNVGSSGTQTSFDNTGVIAGGGLAGSGGVGGLGGNISTNSVHWPGGNGGSNPGNFAASAGGGGRAGSTGAGGNGASPTSNAAPGLGGAAGTGIGGVVGSNGVVAATNGNGGNAGGSGAGAAAGAVQLTKSYRPRHTYSYYGAGVGNGLRNTDGSMFQGNPNVPTNVFPGDEYSIADYGKTSAGTPSGDFSAYTVDSVKIQIANTHSWYNQGCFILWGHANFGSFGSTGNLSGATLNEQTDWINQNTSPTYDITSVWALPIQLGTFSCAILGPGGTPALWNYGIFNGGPSFGPLLTVKGHTGAGNQTAGNGSNGKVIVSYQSSTVMVGALSPVAGTDASGNAFGVGYTGNVQDFTPGANPATVETWHNFSYAGNWSTRTNYNGRYKLISETNQVRVELSANNSGTVSGTSQVTTAVPAAYRPAKAQPLPTAWFGTGTPTASPACEMNTSGVINLFNAVAGTNLVQLNAVYSLD